MPNTLRKRRGQTTDSTRTRQARNATITRKLERKLKGGVSCR